MKRLRQGVPAVPSTTPLASDVSMPPLVDEATAEATTELAQALATGAIDTDPAPVIDGAGDGMSAADAVAIATADAQAAAPVEPLVPVPGTVALPADQLTPMLPVGTVSEMQSRVATIEADTGVALRVPWDEMASLGVRIDLMGERLEAIEDRLEEIDGIVLTIDGEGKVTAAGADLSRERLAQLRRDVLGARADLAFGLSGRASPTHRAFPVLHEVLQDGRKIRPNSRDRVRLTEVEHSEAIAGGIITLPWDDGDPVEDDL